MPRIENKNAYAAIVTLVLIAIVWTGYYVTIPVHGLVYNTFINETNASGYLSESTCKAAGYFWNDVECRPLPDRAMDISEYSRDAWLLAPIIFSVGMIFWFLTQATKKDPQEYYR